MDIATQTMRQRASLELANRGHGARVAANARPGEKHSDPIGVLGSLRVLAARLRAGALETVVPAIREKPRM
jgi:hypothetical protein